MDDFFTLLTNQENWHHEQNDLGEEDNGYFYDSTWSATVMQGIRLYFYLFIIFLCKIIKIHFINTIN